MPGDLCTASRIFSLSFLPSHFLTCCGILPTSFGGKGPHLWRWLVAQPLHQTDSKLRFSGVFLSCKARSSVHSPRDHFIITLSLATDVTDVTLGAGGFWLGTRTGAWSFFGRSLWLHERQKKSIKTSKAYLSPGKLIQLFLHSEDLSTSFWLWRLSQKIVKFHIFSTILFSDPLTDLSRYLRSPYSPTLFFL